jgi:hypothetical protein
MKLKRSRGRREALYLVGCSGGAQGSGYRETVLREIGGGKLSSRVPQSIARCSRNQTGETTVSRRSRGDRGARSMYAEKVLKPALLAPDFGGDVYAAWFR